MTGEGDAGDVIRRGRFSGGPARGFLSSMADDARLFAADLAVDRAHVVMLAEQDVIDDGDAAAILDALDAVEAAGFDALPDAEDVHAAIETAVIERVGDRGGRMHTARSRNDEVAACIRLRLRDDLLDAARATLELRRVIVDVAGDHVDTVMPGYTHQQPAQPTTLAHWLLSYEGGLRRDTARLLDAYGRVNASPLGAAALAGTPFPVDRGRVADLLGFDGVVENAMDAAASRDVAVEAAGAFCALAVTLSGIAADGIGFAGDGYLELDDDYASTSSIMPQKKNPDTLELVRAAAGDATGAYAGLVTTLKGLPRAYNRDLQSATPHVWRAVDAVTEAARVTAGALATAAWDAEALAADAGEGFATATGVADRLAMAGVPFRTAHEVVARAAAAGGDVGALEDAAREVLGEPLGAVVDRDEIEAALDPAASVAMRDSHGGPAPDRVRDAVERAGAAVEEDRAAVEAAAADVGEAEARLDRAVGGYG